MRRRRQSRRSGGQLIMIVLVLLLIGGTGYGIYSLLPDNEEEEFVDYYKKPIGEKGTYIHDSHYDYAELAKSITAGCDNNYRKIRAIYQWICENIEYDVSYSIHTADSCYAEKKGVCQAYCELFYQIAKAAGVSAEIIGGQSKDQDGEIGRHAWIFAYTRENYGMLMDPTWGAGSVNDGKFSRSEDCWSWFNVHPEWMILSHFPEEESYQLLTNPLSMEEFVSLAPVNSVWIEYGLDAHLLYEKIRNGELDMLKFYGRGKGQKLKIVSIPMTKRLMTGETYTFRFIPESGKKWVIINGEKWYNDWQISDDGVYSITIKPTFIGSLKLSVQLEADGPYWSCLEYEVIN